MKEPEEVIESKVVALLEAAGTGVEVVGALAVAPDGVEKAAPYTCISVAADMASQNLDWKAAGVPCTYSVRVGVRVAFADDKTGGLFRDTCRAVRAALAVLTGDGCAALDGDGFSCDSFVFGTTYTSMDSASEIGSAAKVYNATLTGRFIPPADDSANQQEES